MGIDGAAPVLDHHDLEPRGTRIDGRPRDAEVRRETEQEHAVHATLVKIAGEPGACATVGFYERRITVGVRVIALAHDELRMGDV